MISKQSKYLHYWITQLTTNWQSLALLILGIVSSVLILVTHYQRSNQHDTHLTWLADSFVHLNLAYGIDHPTGDVVDYYGNFYSYFGPMASAVFVPFVAIWGRDFPQLSLGVLSLLMSLLLVYQLAKNLKFSTSDSLWWACFFCFSTVMLGVSLINITAYQVQALGSVFVLASLVEYFGKRRYWLISTFIALAGATRMTLFLVGMFYFLDWFHHRKKAKDLLLLVLPILLVIGLISIYNYRRFGSLGESGYKYNITLNHYPMSQNLKQGFLHWHHIPTNLYAMFLKGPEPILKSGGGYVLEFPYLKVDPWGLSLFISSPLFLLLLLPSSSKKYQSLIRQAWITVGLILLPILMYFGIGYSQFGYRYALDFIPLLLIILMLKMPGTLVTSAKVLILTGVFFNCFFLMSVWGVYPWVFVELNEFGVPAYGWQWWRLGGRM